VLAYNSQIGIIDSPGQTTVTKHYKHCNTVWLDFIRSGVFIKSNYFMVITKCNV